MGPIIKPDEVDGPEWENLGFEISPSCVVECKINTDASEMRDISEGLKAIYFVSFIQGVKKKRDFRPLCH